VFLPPGEARPVGGSLGCLASPRLLSSGHHSASPCALPMYPSCLHLPGAGVPTYSGHPPLGAPTRRVERTSSAATARPTQWSGRRAIRGGGGGVQAAHRAIILDWRNPPQARHLCQEGSQEGTATGPPRPFQSRRQSRAIDRPSGMQPRDGAVPATTSRFGERLST
jgi:hypothetical protein